MFAVSVTSSTSTNVTNELVRGGEENKNLQFIKIIISSDF
jgi:hypothetical protein